MTLDGQIGSLTGVPCTYEKWRVAEDTLRERNRQDERWGEQNHPDGTGGAAREYIADAARNNADRAASVGTLTWLDILNEEVAEAFAESDPEKLRAELVQVAAVAAAWVECIDRRSQRG